jgi:ribonucleases P/MRP protein subunit RPP40
MSDKKGIGPLLDENKNVIHDDKGMADLLNKHFSSVFIKDDANQLGPELDHINVAVQLGDINITYDKVSKKIDELKVGKSPGPDGISNNILKKLKTSVIRPLQILFQLSLQTGDLPSDWRVAKVVAIFKKGAKGLATNHRPVSLTSGVCKMLEGIIREEITDYLYTNALLNQTQHGFMKDRSCQTNLLEFMDMVTQAVDEGKPVDAVYLDFSKAFDKISHPKLMQKLHAYGITGKVKNWIQSWLTNRKQYVSVNGAESEVETVTSGVPQGSVLGPLLFILFINDIDDTVAMIIDIIRKFADDTKLAKTVQTQEDADKLQECLNKLFKWSQDWSMEFNVKKCKVMHIGRRNQSFNYYINGIELAKVEKERDIGVCVNSNLKPSKHCQESASKARAVLGQISRCFHFRDKVVFLRLYKQFVRPHLEFSSSVWSPWSLADVQMLEDVQKKAVNMISGLVSRSYEDRLAELNLWTLEKRREMLDMVQVHKIVNRVGNVKCGLKFVRDRSNYLPTRNQSDPLNLVKSRCNLDVRRHFFCERVVDSWNRIPTHIKHTADIKKFKQKLVQWM